MTESRPHQAVYFVVERDKEMQGKRFQSCCLVTVEEGCQQVKKRRKRTRMKKAESEMKSLKK